MTNPALRLLAVRMGRAGDMVMLTPALKAIFAVRPAARIHLLTGPEGKRLLSGWDPRLSQFLVCRAGAIRRLLDWARIRRRILSENYDRILVFESDPRFIRLLRDVPAPVFRIESRPPDQHYSECSVQLVERGLGEPVPRFKAWLPVTDSGKRKAAEYFHAAGIEDSAVIVGFHSTFSSAGAPSFRKRKARIHRSWPAARFASLAKKLHEFAAEKGIPLRIVMDVLPEESSLVEEIRQGSAGLIQILSGPPDFDRYKAVLVRMNLLVTPDTGPMHIAAAVGTPLVALFSLKSPADCGPYCEETRAVVLRAEDFQGPELGLAAITANAVFQSCANFLSRQAEKLPGIPSD
jgi:heptosyltransferase I